MSHAVNTVLTDSLIFVDLADALVTGKVNGDFVCAAYAISAPATTATVTVTEIVAQPGNYLISFTPTLVSDWQVNVACTHLAYTYRWEQSYTVDLFAESAVQADATNLTTRLAIRRRVSDLLSDLKIATATVVGSTTQFTDSARLSAPLNAYAGREAYFTGGTIANLGQQRYVSASTTSGQLTVAALPAAVQVGDEIELRNMRNQSWGVDEIHRAINSAASDGDVGLWAIAQNTVGTFFWTAPTLTIPSNYAFIHGVDYQDSSGFWHEIEPANSSDLPGWWVVRGQRLLQINGSRGWGLDGASIRISGSKRFSPMTVDTDTTGINPEWLCYQTAAYLLMQGSERMGDQSRTQKYMTYQSRADRLRDLVNGVGMPNMTAVL